MNLQKINELSNQLNNLFSTQPELLMYAFTDLQDGIFKLHDIKYNVKSQKINTLIYKPIDDVEVYISTMDLKGNVKEQKIKYYYVHFGLNGYKLTYKEETNYYKVDLKENKTFIVSDDASLVVYNKKTNHIIRIKPQLALKNKEHLYFLVEKALVQNCEIYNDRLALLPLTAFEFEKVKNVTMYDFSFDDKHYTNFQIANGIYVVDTVVVHALHTEEAKEEARQKMFLAKTFSGLENIDALTTSLGKNVIFGLVYGSMDPKLVNYKPKKLKIDISNVKTKEQLLELLKQEKEWCVYDYIGDKTIGQLLIELSVKKVLDKVKK